MHAARGILTARGGMTSHAAVVARGMGRPCVSGAGAVSSIDAKAETLTVGGRELKRGRYHHARRLDRRGHGRARCRRSSRNWSGDFGTLMVWADGRGA